MSRVHYRGPDRWSSNGRDGRHTSHWTVWQRPYPGYASELQAIRLGIIAGVIVVALLALPRVAEWLEGVLL